MWATQKTPLVFPYPTNSKWLAQNPQFYGGVFQWLVYPISSLPLQSFLFLVAGIVKNFDNSPVFQKKPYCQ